MTQGERPKESFVLIYPNSPWLIKTMFKSGKTGLSDYLQILSHTELGETNLLVVPDSIKHR